MKTMNYSPEHLTSNRHLFWIAAVLGVIMMAPVAWIIGLSLKDNAELLKGTEAVFAMPYTLVNYANILESSSVFGWFINSMIVAIGQTIGVLLLSSLAGYAFARLEFPSAKHCSSLYYLA